MGERAQSYLPKTGSEPPEPNEGSVLVIIRDILPIKRGLFSVTARQEGKETDSHFTLDQNHNLTPGQTVVAVPIPKDVIQNPDIRYDLIPIIRLP